MQNDTVNCVVCNKELVNSFPTVWYAAGLPTCGPEHQRQKLQEIAAALNRAVAQVKEETAPTQ